MTVWDWANEQVVRADRSGPGRDTPPDVTLSIVVALLAGLDAAFATNWKTDDPVVWNFGDGQTMNAIAGDTVDHTYSRAGVYTVVVDAGAGTDDAAIITVEG